MGFDMQYETRSKTVRTIRPQPCAIGSRFPLLLLVHVLWLATAHGQTNHTPNQAKPSGALTPLYPAPCVMPIPLYALVEESWDRGVDTTAYHPGKDTMHTRARERVKHCALPFGGTSNRPWEQLDVARLQLALGNDALAAGITDGYLKSLATAPEMQRAWALLLIIQDYLSASPVRFSEARAALKQLDALGRTAIPYRFRAYFALAETARRYWDDALSEYAFDEILTQWRQLPQEEAERLQSIAGTAYLAKAEIAQRVRSVADARHIMDSAKASLQQMRYWSGSGEYMWKLYHEFLGAAAPTISATWWFGRQKDDHAPRPRKGVVTVVQNGSEWSKPQEMRAAARWAHRFGDKVELITLNNTNGWIRDTAPIVPKDEAEYRYGEMQRLFHLPGLMGIFETEYDWLRDGRRVNRPVTTLAQFYFALTIIDTKGTIRYIFLNQQLPSIGFGMGGWDWEELIARKIEQLIAEGERT